MPESYFPLDINFFDHPKVVGLSDKAARLYLSSVAYANRLMTDGFIADAIAGRLVEWDTNDPDAVTPEGCARELDRAVLWHRADVPCPRGHDLTCPKLDIGAGWRVHDFIEHNRSREDRVGNRVKERERKAAYRERLRDTQRDSPPGVPPGHVPPGDEVSHRDNTTQHNTEERRSKPLSVVPTDDTTDVFESWQESTGKRRAHLDPKRRRKIQAALKMFPVQDVKDALWGWLNSPYHCGQNDNGTVYNELTLLLRDAGQIEKFRDLWRDGPPHTVSKTTAQAVRTSQAMRARAEQGGGVNGDLRRVGRSGGPIQRALPSSAD